MGIGAVIISPRSPLPRYFGIAVERDLVLLWMDALSTGTVIGQGELLLVVLAKSTWSALLRNSHAIFWIDNDSARHCLIRGSGKAESSDVLVGTSCSMDAKLDCLAWYERVPSPSNVADAGSRLMFEEYAEKGWTHDSVVWPTLWDGRQLRPV